jgi:hypothetical protein
MTLLKEGALNIVVVGASVDLAKKTTFRRSAICLKKRSQEPLDPQGQHHDRDNSVEANEKNDQLIERPRR